MAAEYDGADALMAAITGEPLPEAARADAEFMAGHRAAVADVALLREQLSAIGDMLAAPLAGAHSPVTAPSRPRAPRPARPVRRGRALRIALGSLAAVVALSAVAGLARLVTENSGSDAQAAKSAGAADAKGGPGEADRRSGDGPPPSDPELTLACDRLVVEGTVARVEPKGGQGSRIVLTVTRRYKPDRGPAQVAFLLAEGAHPGPRRGQHVLVEVARGTDDASRWAVGEDRVAANRAWIVKALSGSRHTACPSDGST
ncbi:hypothetical protein AB0N87_31955 [Streptomyces sp. NPDC093228]|uniref:hypothetical protein n=1 Tax=unclassified Streptomyces TaxID=2593676 RepID=UPI000740EC6C|nr:MULTISPECIES: hypothetical protein [unclassified Streptomyces]KUJ37118.1 hypothetical protein ADL25_29495 [Streptomyces sp. NRRL F-5122]MDX3264155.1 hypothetical protein [Streptomyces sp. MI02-2A]